MRTSKVSFDFMGEKAMFVYNACIYDSPKPSSDYIVKLRRLISDIIKTELTENQRELVMEYYYNGKTIEEIAKQKGVNKGSVSRSLKRARERVATTLRYSAKNLLRERFAD